MSAVTEQVPSVEVSPTGLRPLAKALTAILVGGTALVCAWSWWHGKSARSQVELPRSALTVIHGRLCEAGTSNQFTGIMVESYPSGGVKSRSALREGLLSGRMEGFYTNGQIQVREHFRAGVSHGPRTKWYLTGARLSEATITEGQIHGTFWRWHENGAVAEQIEMRHGQPDGVAWSYYASGCVKGWARLANGAVLEQRSWEDGQRRSQ